MLPADQTEIMEDIMAADDYLSEQKGYGLLGVGRKQRLMHAGMLVTSDYMEQSGDQTMNSAALGGTISLIVAQQATMCAAIAASSAAAASSNSSGS